MSVCHLARWMAMQSCLRPGVLRMPIMLTQDEATFEGSFRWTQAPIYATLACIRAEYRNQPRAGVLIGYLPEWVRDKPKSIGKETYWERKHAVLVAAMCRVLLPLQKLEKTGCEWSFQPGTACGTHAQ